MEVMRHCIKFKLLHLKFELFCFLLEFNFSEGIVRVSRGTLWLQLDSCIVFYCNGLGIGINCRTTIWGIIEQVHFKDPKEVQYFEDALNNKAVGKVE